MLGTPTLLDQHPRHQTSSPTASTQVEEQYNASQWILSVGSTPTAHAAAIQSIITSFSGKLNGKLELHAGNYAFLDQQQLATRAIPSLSDGGGSSEDVAISVLTRIVSIYPGRKADQPDVDISRASNHASLTDEALCDAGGLGLSKDTGPWAGYGFVISPTSMRGWQLIRLSQEHGILTVRDNIGTHPLDIADGFNSTTLPEQLGIGECLRLIPQHACLAFAQHAAFFVVESGSEEIVDVWFPWKGW